MLKADSVVCALSCFILLVFSAERALPQDYGNRLGHREGEEVEFTPRGAWINMGDLEPVQRKYYLPQELLQEYKWQTWESTNYATNSYQRYSDPNLQGDYFYDVFGNYLTRGWLVYDWTEDRPRTSEGTRILKRGEYGGFFSNLIISSDQKGQYSYSVTIGNELFANLTPMTFRKAVFNGTQVDFLSDNYSVTGLFSRISAPGFRTDPNPASFNNYTNLMGGRAKARLGDFVTVGATFINAHSGRATLESFKGNPFKGALTQRQLESANQVTSIVLRLTDDSPADNGGGAILLAHDVEIRTQIRTESAEITPTAVFKDTVLTGNTIGFRAKVEGGTLREGVRVADGTEQITLRYDLLDLLEIMNDPEIANNIRGIRFRLILVNDYRIEMTSNVQTNDENQPIFLVVAQAEGNVKDGSNKKEVVFDYGLPTANQIYGFTLEVNDLMGFSLYTELDVNHRFRQFPNQRDETHKAFSGIVGDETATAWMMNLSRVSFPWSFTVEGFYMEEEYSTSPFIVDGFGLINYEDPTTSLYEFVDDNDDQDRKPDRARIFQDSRTGLERGAEGILSRGFADEAVFPGWDENNDFISDFNQNNNRFQVNNFPDYDEPFLRYNSDRPEYLFGIDLNNNGWIDRFENDNEPDYPYKRDRKGYNVYVQNQLSPHAKLSAGQTRELLLTDDRENVTTYGLFTFERDYPGIGRVKFFNMLKKADDDIQDDLFQWVQPSGTVGSQQFIADPLFAQDAWINTAWLGFERRTNIGVNFANKLKYETISQSQDSTQIVFKEDTRFLGLINKVDYLHKQGILTIQPKLKSEFLRDNTPYSIGRGDRVEREEWAGTLSLVLGFPVLWKTSIQLGVEQIFFQDMLLDEDPLRDDLGAVIVDDEGNPTGTFEVGDFTGDFRNTVTAAQLSNIGNYLGYRLTTHLGLSIIRSSRELFEEDRDTQTTGLVYLTMYASIKD